jgi:hypothetical protein
MSPLEKVEALFQELVDGYHGGEDAELRAAAKLLLVALPKLKQHGGFGWQALVQDYILMLENDPERFARVLDANRGLTK